MIGWKIIIEQYLHGESFCLNYSSNFVANLALCRQSKCCIKRRVRVLDVPPPKNREASACIIINNQKCIFAAEVRLLCHFRHGQKWAFITPFKFSPAPRKIVINLIRGEHFRNEKFSVGEKLFRG